MSDRQFGWRDHLIGVAVAVHLALVVTVGLGRTQPYPGPFVAVSSAWNSWHRASRPVLRRYGELMGPKQSWAMFSGVGRMSSVTHIEVRTKDGWEPVFVERSDAHEWRRLAFDHYLWRELLNLFGRTREPGIIYPRFTNWVAEEAVEAFPDACWVRVRVMRSPSRTPEQLDAGEPRVIGSQFRIQSARVGRRRCH